MLLPVNYAALTAVGRWLVFSISSAGAKMPLSAGVLPYEAACAEVVRLRGLGDGMRYELGYELVHGDGFWCVDIDNLQGEHDQRWQLVQAMRGAGCLVEFSQSGKGVHIWGRAVLPVQHRQRFAEWGYEIYSYNRKMIVGACLQGGVSGDAGALVSPPQWLVVAQADSDAAMPSGPMPGWDGYTDDAELLAAMRRSAGSALGRFSGALSNAQLLDDPALDGDQSQLDSQLCERLAWWTGGDTERVRRLFMASARGARAKVQARPDYVRDTVLDRCQRVRAGGNCHVRPKPAVLPALPPLAPVAAQEVAAAVLPEGWPAARGLIAGATTRAELESACERIMAMGLPAEDGDWIDLQERVRDHAKGVLAIRGFGIAQARAMLPRHVAQVAGGVPDWLEPWVYVACEAKYCHTGQGYRLVARDAFCEECYNLPGTPAGGNGEPIAADKYFRLVGGRVVARMAWRPDCDAYFHDADGALCVNTFTGSMPDAVPVSAESAAVIAQWEAYSRDAYGADWPKVQQWMAFKVQNPGKLPRWALVLIGMPGLGKTSILLRPICAAVGARNYKEASAKGINSDFQDFAGRDKCLTIVNDILIAGPKKHESANSLRPFITDDKPAGTRKGKVDDEFFNYSGYIFTANNHTPIPVDPDERRYLFLRMLGLDEAKRADKAAFQRRATALAVALASVTSGEWRSYFEAVNCDGFPFEAPDNGVLKQISVNGKSEHVQIVEELCDGHDVVPASAIAAAFIGHADAPKTYAVPRLMEQIGYDKLEQRAKINGQKMAIYVKRGCMLENDDILRLARTFNQLQQLLGRL